jgi:hypothetical protein
MKILSRILLTLCLPAFLLSPVPSIAFLPQYQQTGYIENVDRAIEIPRDEFGRVNPWILFLPENLSFNRYTQFIQLVEDEEFLESLTLEEFDIVVDFVTKVVRFSAPESRPDLQEEYEFEIDELIEDLYGEAKLGFSLWDRSDFKVIPAVCSRAPEFILCKGWLKKKAHHFGHWCSKHKKPLIIGAVVVGVVAVAVATGGIGGSSAAAVGGALVDAGVDNEHPKSINKPGEVSVDGGEFRDPPFNASTQNATSSDYPSPGGHSNSKTTSLPPVDVVQTPQSASLISPQLEEYVATVNEQADYVKEDLIGQIPSEPLNILPQEEPSFWTQVIEKGRELTSQFTHGVYGLITDQLEPVAEIEGITTDLLEKTSPNLSEISPFEKNPKDAFKEQVAEGHRKIDEVFDTQYASLYSDEAKAAESEIAIGILPFPGAGAKTLKTSSKFFEKNIKHILRDDPGHLPNTPANRQLLLDVAGNPENFLGVDKHGNAWHAKTQSDGTQIWTSSRGGEIRNGGINSSPKPFTETGLSKGAPPKP